MTPWLLLGGAYLLGSVSWSVLIVRALTGRDLRSVGSGNAGATNALRAAGKGPALAVLALDVAKGVAPVLVARHLEAGPAVVAAVAVAAVVGHVLPVFHGFRGGKGVATAAGALTALAPAPGVAVMVLFVTVVSRWRYVSLGSIVAALAFAPLILVCERTGLPVAEGDFAVVAAALVAGIILLRHADNLRRLIAGTERRLGGPRPAAGRLEERRAEGP